jgi:hypothetical protein
MGEVRASQGHAARHGDAVIELRLKTLAQLYDSLGPSPFREKALDRNVESWLIECADEHGPDQSLRLVVHAAPEVLPQAAAVADAVHTHFRLASESAERRHRARLRIHRFAMLLGLVVLAVTLALRRLIGDLGGELAAVLGESLLILPALRYLGAAAVAARARTARDDAGRTETGLKPGTGRDGSGGRQKRQSIVAIRFRPGSSRPLPWSR